MHPFERLLTGSEQDVAAMFARFATNPTDDVDRRLEAIGHAVGLNPSQLVCAFGFSAHAVALPRVLSVLGFSSYDAMWSRRNYVFINDVYQRLSIDNVLDIYREVGRNPAQHDIVPDLILSRLNNIESQIEATINPVILGSYKLEIRGLYENRLASPELLDIRMSREYEVLRGLADEVALAVRAGALTATQVLHADGITPEEKRRMLFLGLVSRAEVEQRLRAAEAGDVERRILTDALAQESG